MAVKVIKTGMLTSVQDLGRIGFARFGVPQSGVMDRYASKMANMLVGNNNFEPVLEITLAGPTLEFQKTALIGLSGIDVKATLNGNIFPVNEAVKINEGDCLKIKQVAKGARAYLAIHGGFSSEEIMGSQSMYENITKFPSLQAGTELSYTVPESFPAASSASVNFRADEYDSSVLWVFKGPEFEKLDENVQKKLVGKKFTLSKDNSRMAYQLEEPLKNNLKQILTQPVIPGTVQLTPSGKIIVLMRDCQTTGGYPRILQMTEKSLNVLAQKKAGDEVSFELLEN